MRCANTLLAILLALGTAAAATAQEREEDIFLRQQHILDMQLDQQRQVEAPLESLFDWQYGGWLDYYIFNFSDGVQSSRTNQQPGMAAWMRIVADNGAHEAFARARLTYSYYDHGDEFTLQQDWIGPNFDQAWHQIDVGKAFRWTQPADPVQLKFRIGRQPVTFGTGYAFDIPLDAVTFDLKLWDARVLGLVGRTIGSFPNIDTSYPVGSHSNRYMYGVQAQYEGLQRHVPFAYAIWNNDATDERPQNPFQDYAYDTFYFGFGSRGELEHNLNYWGEVVFESGRGYNNRAEYRRNVVDSYGWDVGVEKIFDAATRPRIVGEYMFGSGDADRLYSSTNAAGGNTAGKDHSFVGFGFRDTGIAISYVPANLHIWRAGASFNPLEPIEFFRDLELGTNWFLYYKHKANGPLSDPLADANSGYAGWEMDYFLNWRIASDLSWTVRWGTFFPGSTYSDRTARPFIFSGLTWSF